MKCPKCEKLITELKGEEINIQFPATKIKIVAYLCPHCYSIISVGIHPNIYQLIMKKLKI